VGTAGIVPGQITQGELPLAWLADGPIAAPVMVAAGLKPGPTLWVQAAIHGGEIGGTLGLVQAIRSIDLADLSGTIVAVLAANPLAFRAQTRNSPQDGENMNRLFPGTLDGTITRQMAQRLMTAATETADIVVDLHSGGIECFVPFYGLYFQMESDASRLAGKLASAVGGEAVWAARDEWLSGAMIVQLTKLGIPALIVECGGGLAHREDIDRFALSVINVAKAAGLILGDPVMPARQKLIGSCELVFTSAGGFFVPDCAAGDSVAAGASLGRVLDIYGAEQERIVAGKPGYIAAIGRMNLPVHSGAMIGELNDEHGWLESNG
jgi:predicted deacylase